jgi:para-nitrobenzyl esterase
MALTAESTIGALLANESAKAIIEKHLPGMTSDPRLKMAMGMTLKQIMPLSQGKITLSKIEAISVDLAAL